MKTYTCPHCKKKSESIGVQSYCNQTLHIKTDDWSDLEVGDTVEGYCLECSTPITETAMTKIMGSKGNYAPLASIITKKGPKS